MMRPRRRIVDPRVIKVKLVGGAPQIESVIETLRENYRLISITEILRNDRDAGFHCYLLVEVET